MPWTREIGGQLLVSWELAGVRNFVFHLVGSPHELFAITLTQRRLCTRHRLHHVPHRFVWSPTQPSQPADSALCRNSTLALPRPRVSPWYTLSLTHNRGIVKSCRALTPAKAVSFRCYRTLAACANGLGMLIVRNLL